MCDTVGPTRIGVRFYRICWNRCVIQCRKLCAVEITGISVWCSRIHSHATTWDHHIERQWHAWTLAWFQIRRIVWQNDAAKVLKLLRRRFDWASVIIYPWMRTVFIHKFAESGTYRHTPHARGVPTPSLTIPMLFTTHSKLAVFRSSLTVTMLCKFNRSFD